jgi:RNA polymerase sigma-70 factor, ECF subfamily
MTAAEDRARVMALLPAKPRRLSRQEAEEFFGEIYGAFARHVFAVVCQITGDHHVAQDIVQESFMKLYRRLHAERTDRRVAAWLRKVASNAALDYLRKKRKAPPMVSVHDGADCADPPHLNESQNELCRRIAEHLARLPDRKRAVFEMKALDGMSYDEIGAAVKCSRRTACAIFCRVRQKIVAVLVR